MYKINLCKDEQTADITNLVSDLSWSEDLDTVGLSLSFSVPDTDEKYITRLMIMAGDIIQVLNDEGELIRAVIVNVSRNYPKRTVKAFDFGFYLNKNDVVIQFKDKSVSECLKELFAKVNISIGEVCDMPAKVNGVYIKNLNETVKELIKIQQDNDGKKYYYELRSDKIYVFQLPTEPIDYIFKPASNVASFDVTDKKAHGRGKYTHSIENMKNQVTAVINSKTTGNLPAVEYTVKDEESIKKYGLLSENYSVNSDDLSNIKSLANNELKDKNDLKRELSMDFIGHDNARPGRVMHIIDDYLCIDDYFRINSVNHKISGNTHTMSCNLEYIKSFTNYTATEGEIIQREDVSSESSSTNANFSNFNSALTSQLGKHYVWGASGPDSFDCSGLVYYCLNQSGTKVSRMTAQGYYNACTKINASDRQPGDLIFWATNGRVYHVAVYVGGGMQIGAETYSTGVIKKKVTANVYAYGRLS